MREGNNGRVAYRFYTRQLPTLTALRIQWYPEGKKIVPNDLVLDPMILAVWFMDDGSMCRESDVYLNTQQFDLISQQRLIYKLEQLGIYGRLNKDKNYQRIRFLKSSIPALRDMIQSRLVPSMKYKLVMTP